jgi:hypothetical protein
MKTKAVNMRMTEEEIRIIKAYGFGCFIAGIRRMLANLKESCKNDQNNEKKD